MSQICNTLNYPHTTTVKNTVLAVKAALDNEEEYNCKRQKFCNEDTQKIKEGSFEQELLTRYMEKGASFQTTMRVFNAVHNAELNLPRTGTKAIYNAVKRTNHITAPTTSIPQTNGSNLFHCQALYNWFSQLLVRMGENIPTPLIEQMSDLEEG